MKTVTSEERTTRMGATRYTAILQEGKWVRISEMPHACYSGRNRGVEFFAVEVDDDAVWASFYRSNKGNEHVEASNGMHWRSFAEAERWARGDGVADTCLYCGQEM